MSILSLFVLIPALMLLGLWLARNLNQVRGVMVTGASCLLLLSIWLTVTFIQMRAGGNTDEMLFTYSIPWFEPLHIEYAVGVDGISVVMLLFVKYHCIYRNICFMAAETSYKRVFPLVYIVEYRCLRILHQHRYVHNVHVL